MPYIDGFVIAAPTADKEKFVDHARRLDALFLEHGATRVVECWGDDVPDGKLTDFRRAVQAKADETVVFSWIEWPDKKTRDAGMARTRTDPRMVSDPAMPFDGKHDLRRIRAGGRAKKVAVLGDEAKRVPKPEKGHPTCPPTDSSGTS